LFGIRPKSEINYDIDAKVYAEHIANRLGIKTTLLISLQARKLFFLFANSAQFSNVKDFAAHMSLIIDVHDKTGRKKQVIDLPQRRFKS